MEYVYAALILHESGTEITEDNLTNVLEAADVDVNESRIEALVAALEDVDIEEALDQPMAPVAGGAPAAGATAEPESAETEEAEEEGAAEEGLGNLFG